MKSYFRWHVCHRNYNIPGGLITMTIEQKIKMATAYKGISQAALARAIGMTPSNFNQKIKRETFTKDELETIAIAMGAVYTAVFEFPDGTKI
jgi:DNA-binding XRE family transcriptional regulator